VIVMRLRGEEERVSSLAPVVESETSVAEAEDSDEATGEPVVESEEGLAE